MLFNKWGVRPNDLEMDILVFPYDGRLESRKILWPAVPFLKKEYFVIIVSDARVVLFKW